MDRLSESKPVYRRITSVGSKHMNTANLSYISIEFSGSNYSILDSTQAFSINH